MNEGLAAGSPLCTLRISIADMISLNVRTKGIKNLQLPQVLHQSLPEKAMTLMATLPHGSFAVSIPGENSRRRGYPIRKNLPQSPDGFVIAYSRKPNGRYEADAVHYQNKILEIGEFVQIAFLWMAQRFGQANVVPARYAYFAPSREEWGVILRDSGYVAWDPSNMPSGGIADLGACRRAQNSSAVVGRIPVYAGEKQPLDVMQPVFAQVEAMPDPEFSASGGWMSFFEYQQLRSLRARLPESIIADYQEWLSRFAEESGFQYWVFDPGMLFGDCVEWWGDCARRRTEHEGIDFAKGFLPGSGICRIPDSVPIRSIADGEIAAILDDFIGKTVVVRHPSIVRPNGDVFHTLLSHIRPLGTETGFARKGEILGNIGKLTNTPAPAHLHLTGAWFAKDLVSGEITLDHIHPAFDRVALTDFNDLMRHNPLCRPGLR
jgi:murein DD-endopeptidase MepM/ murein hydrolase activator NlpD